jgi:hypothetical protein
VIPLVIASAFAAHQKGFEAIEDISAEEWDVTFRTDIYSMFYLCKVAIPHMKPGNAIVNTTSINTKNRTPHLLAYATTKGAIANFTAGLAAMVAERGIRVNAVAPVRSGHRPSHPRCRKRP